ncbi:MAG TPA: polysaccharide deacetylase family protein [Patescibacteria group bacterium]|nr:polysaccharide deacetylase family protein [Patescibacteria group bacterium]
MRKEKQIPFINGETETLKQEAEFDLHKLGHVEKSFEIPGGQEKEFSGPEYGVTEYFDDGGKNHEQFVKLKKFYEATQAELGDYLPKAMFVEGAPSNASKEGKSFYVVQKYEQDEFYKTAKKLDELNSKEFSVEFLDQLLNIQERINKFLGEHGKDLPVDWIDNQALDAKQFKEDVLHSPKTADTKITNLFKFNPDLVKQISGNEQKFEPSVDRLRVLKALGLAHLVEKIDWAIEKSAAPEWIKGKNVHWSMDKNKLEQEGKKAMALTFDDGPNEETEKLLDILKEMNTKATFFLVGSLIKGREHTVKRIIDEGHDVGVHEWAQEGAKPKAGLKEYSKRFVGPRKDLGDVKKTTDLIQQVTGEKPTIGRIAGVHGTVDSLREFQAMGLEVVHGNPYDVVAIPPSKTLKAENLLKKALSSNGQGRIRIFHIGTMEDTGLPMQRSEVDYDKGEVFPADETLKMIKRFIQQSNKQGYEFVKVKEYI